MGRLVQHLRLSLCPPSSKTYVFTCLQEQSKIHLHLKAHGKQSSWTMNDMAAAAQRDNRSELQLDSPTLLTI